MEIVEDEETGDLGGIVLPMVTASVVGAVTIMVYALCTVVRSSHRAAQQQREGLFS